MMDCQFGISSIDGKSLSGLASSAVAAAAGAHGQPRPTPSEKPASPRELDTDREAMITRLMRGWTWETDAEHRIVYMSESVEAYAAKPREWHYGKTRDELGTVDYSQPQWRRYREQVARREPFGPIEYPRRDGIKVFWMRTQGEPRFDVNGRFLGYRGIACDVNEEIEARAMRRRAEAAVVERTIELAQANEKLSIRLQQLAIARERVETLATVKSELITRLIDELSEPLLLARRLLQQAETSDRAGGTRKHLVSALALVEQAETAVTGMLLTAGLEVRHPVSIGDAARQLTSAPCGR
jgi:hypothetical protein